MRSVRLVCDRVEHNNYKYYDLDLVQDLLQNWCVNRRWGRIGAWECRQTRGFTTREEAEAEFRRLEAKERNEGYVDAPAQKSRWSASPQSTPGNAILGFIPRHRHPILDHRLDAVFARTRQVSVFLRKLRGHGICYVGHLVQAPLPLLRQLANDDERLLAYIERRLLELDLQLGSRAPGWYKVVVPDSKDCLPLWSATSPSRPLHPHPARRITSTARRLAVV